MNQSLFDLTTAIDRSDFTSPGCLGHGFMPWNASDVEWASATPLASLSPSTFYDPVTRTRLVMPPSLTTRTSFSMCRFINLHGERAHPLFARGGTLNEVMSEVLLTRYPELFKCELQGGMLMPDHQLLGRVLSGWCDNLMEVMDGNHDTPKLLTDLHATLRLGASVREAAQKELKLWSDARAKLKSFSAQVSASQNKFLASISSGAGSLRDDAWGKW